MKAWIRLSLLVTQPLGAWLSQDAGYVGLIAAINAGTHVTVLRRSLPWRKYGSAAFLVVWGLGALSLMHCAHLSTWSEVTRCARHPGTPPLVASMATLAVCLVSSLLTRGQVSRAMLRAGLPHHWLWVFFNVSVIAKALINAGRRTEALLRRDRRGGGIPSLWKRLSRFIDLRLAVLSGAVVRTMARHLDSGDALDSRVRGTSSTPVFLIADKLEAPDLAIAVLSLASIIVGVAFWYGLPIDTLPRLATRQ